MQKRLTKMNSLFKKKRIIFSLVVAIMMVVNLISSPLVSRAASTDAFKDIQNHWAKNDIEFLVSKNLLNGYEDGSFRPDKPVTRAEASAVIVNELKLPINTMTIKSFPDVDKNNWAIKDIYTAANNGFLGGYTDGTFRPNKPLTRAELSSILVRAYDLKEISSTETVAFKDVKESQWFYNSVNVLNENNLVSGFNDGTFKPNGNVTRAEFSAFIARIVRNNESNPEMYYTFKHTKTPPSPDSYLHKIRTGSQYAFEKTIIDRAVGNLHDTGINISEADVKQALKEAYYTGDAVYVNDVVFYHSFEPYLDWKDPMVIMWH